MDTARVIEVIETTLTRRGDGKDTPIRLVTEYFDKDGNKLAEVDPHADEDLAAEVRRLTSAIKWALGESGAFSPPEDTTKTPYWWRKELRERAGL